MNHVTYISAGAGSGKTFTLTSILADLIIKGKAAPEEFILTTFTKPAAAEFKEKAKAKIFEQHDAPRYAEYAERLDQAMIGTVDSVSYTFVQKYWYLLGISPNLKMIDDDQKKFFVGQVLASMATPTETAFLKDFCEQFGISYGWNDEEYGLNYDFWKADVKEIFEKSKNYNVKDLSLSRQKSLDFAQELTDSKNSNYNPKTFETLMSELKEDDDGANKKRSADIQKYHFLTSKNLRIADMAGFRSFLKGLPAAVIKRLSPQTQTSLQSALDSLSDIYLSQRVRDYVIKYINLIFDYAQKAQAAFEEYKEKQHLIDFTDMEAYFLELLDMPEVQQDIRDSYKYVFVDEFQDSSPVQVQIFDKLSEIVGSDQADDLIVTVGTGQNAHDFHTHNSIWVGDFKQAIYGFRGADTELTKAVADIIAQRHATAPKQYMIHSLDTSYRSLEDIVEFTNDVFVPAFANVLTKEQVELKANRKNKANINCLKYWKIEGSNANERVKELAAQIAKRIQQGEAPSDYAVLARINTDLEGLSKALNALNVPVCRPIEIDESRDELTLLTAFLNLVNNQTDNYSRAVIAFLTQEDFSVGKIIDTKLKYNVVFKAAKDEAEQAGEKDPTLPEYLSNNELISKFMERVNYYKVQTIHNLVESLVIGLDLYSIGHSWKDASGTDEVFNALIEASYDYEERCLQAGLPPTINGYIDYCKKNTKSSGSKNGVTLTTYHGSKGLEWKNVILMGLDKDAKDEQTLFKFNVFGVQKYHETAPSEANLYPPMIINLMPTIFKNDVVPEVIPKIKASSRYNSICETSISETIRLLYVAITRARDNLILATNGGTEGLHMFKCLGCEVTAGYSFEEDECVDLFNNGHPFLFERKMLDEDEALQQTEYQKFILNTGSGVVKDARDLMPSSMKGGEVQAQLIDCGAPVTVTGSYEADELGTCIHDIFCVAENKSDAEIIELVKAYGFAANFPACGEIKKSWSALSEWLQASFGAAQKQYHELPFKHKLATDQIVSGSMDFVWETAEGCVVVDYKTFPGKKEDLLNKESKYYVGKYKGQLECYEQALTTAGKKVLGKYLYYPMIGVLVNI